MEKSPKLIAFCAMPEGMIIHFGNASAQKSRKRIIEFILINHPLNCPICAQ